MTETDDFGLVQAAVMPSSLSTPNVGGAKTTTPITGHYVSEIHCPMAGALASGSDRVQYAKFFAVYSGSGNPPNSRIWLDNIIDDAPGDATFGFRGLSASDDDSKFARFVGFDVDGDPLYVEVPLDGTTQVDTVEDFSIRDRVEIRDAITWVLTPLVGAGIVYQGATEIARIGQGFYSAPNGLRLGLAGSLNDTATTTNAATPPIGIAFSKPRSYAGGLAVANGGVFTSGSGQGGWSEWTVHKQSLPCPDIQVVVGVQGDDEEE